MNWFFLSDTPDARCARHAASGFFVGLAIAFWIECVRGQSSSSNDAIQIKMSLYWMRNAIPIVGAVLGSLCGLFVVCVRWLLS
jgi:hypothetical protein